jgi:hypothetical protein
MDGPERIKLSRYAGICEQRFDFRRPGDSVIGYMEEERFDSEPVAHEDQSLGAAIPESETELASKLLHEVQPVAFEQVQGNLTVGLGLEDGTIADEFRTDALVVVELAIAGEDRLSIGANERLITGEQIDNRKAGVAHSQALVALQVVSGTVGPAMAQSSNHVMQGGFILPIEWSRIEKAGYATHYLIASAVV